MRNTKLTCNFQGWLVTQDRSEEAYDILVKYHAEGDRESEFVRAEFAQMNTAIQIEVEASKKSWLSLFASQGMRRRVFITTFLGLFTQWSGNTLISYYLGDLLAMIGHTDSVFKQKINLSVACWSLVCGFTFAMLVTRFKRRTMYLACTVSLLLVYISWTISMQQSMKALDEGGENKGAGVATIFFIYLYSPAYNLGYNALTYTYLVEIWPYAERSRGIAFFQLFGRLAGFFTTFVNPIGLDNIGWKWLITYCCWLAFEIVFVWFFFPETSNRTLEELSFSKWFLILWCVVLVLLTPNLVFEDQALADRTNMAVEKVVHNEDVDPVTFDVKRAPSTDAEQVERVNPTPPKV